MDVVPCHTSIEHPWFARRIPSATSGLTATARRTTGSPRSAARRGRATRAPGAGTCTPSIPSSPTSTGAARTCARRSARRCASGCARGVDGFRLDAIDRLLKDPELRDDPPATRPPALPEHGDVGTLEHVHSRNAPDIGLALAALREAVGDDTLLVGEVYLPAAQLGPYLEHVDCAFAFELLHAPWDAAAPFAARSRPRWTRPGAAGRVAWVLSNHDFPRLPDRYGARNARAAALLALTLPGAVFVYQGDEIGMADGPGARSADRPRRPRRRTATRCAGTTTRRTAASRARARGRGCRPSRSTAAAWRSRPATRTPCSRCTATSSPRGGALGPGLTFLDDVADGVLAFRRGADHVVALNMSDAPAAGAAGRDGGARDARRAPPRGHAGAARLAPGEGFLALR